MKNKRFKRTQRKNSKHKQIKRFKPADVRLREKREAAVQQEAKARYRYHQLRLQKGISVCTHLYNEGKPVYS